jgi:hypothetical protein
MHGVAALKRADLRIQRIEDTKPQDSPRIDFSMSVTGSLRGRAAMGGVGLGIAMRSGAPASPSACAMAI